MSDPIVVLGEGVPCGTYVLRVALARPLSLAFGRFKGGEMIDVPAGVVVYVGSAMGRSGSTTLARRLLRHAGRSDGPPHPIRAAMLERFVQVGLAAEGLRPGRRKTVHWHIDYLLEAPAATLSHVLVLRSATRLEGKLARLLAADPDTFVLAPGLGAADAPGETHLLGAPAGERWWANLVERVSQRIPH